ncbi:CinA family protein [Lichenifustis flavocetrariae]|uniref:CinA family protein n=1 Tax=Lichenifustis flavocetrariae TaxID=2949735 RepID=A0AA42CNE2_9HYPH|nr:CinA family protein [Lichenifustis flavocetrariae]MCW6509317.1 CinA family protein [Lichenifustis flavocetrariae]
MSGPFADHELARAADLIAACRTRGFQIATAESCTGGLVAALLTEVTGSSAVFDRGFVTYSNAAKHDMLGVPQDTLAHFGAVSAETAEAMARGAIDRSGAALAVAITGIAGPGGGSVEKPVGLVFFGLARRKGDVLTVERRFGDLGRNAVRRAALDQALQLLEQASAAQV